MYFSCGESVKVSCVLMSIFSVGYIDISDILDLSHLAYMAHLGFVFNSFVNAFA